MFMKYCNNDVLFRNKIFYIGVYVFIDTHCHLDMMIKKKFNDPLKEEDFSKIGKIVDESRVSGVTKIINVGTSVQGSLNSIAIANKFDNVFAAVGIHPCDLRDDWKSQIGEIEKLNGAIAIGETGLDFYHKPFNKHRQIDGFKAHIEIALEKKLPIIIHMREATSEVLKVIEEYASDLTGVNHCFQGSKDIAKHFIDWGFYLGINAPVNYTKNDVFREVVKEIPIENIILETDAPFLPPQEFRGQANHPKYLSIFAKTIAELKGISLKELGEITTKNASCLFKI